MHFDDILDDGQPQPPHALLLVGAEERLADPLISSGGIPFPVSATEMETSPLSAAVVETVIRPPAGIASMAFWIRLNSTV
jgi:hypothetical protein